MSTEPKETRECPVCHRATPADDFTWISDRYGIPFRKVCTRRACVEATEKAIADWIFDPADAGECLEPEE